MYKKAFTLIELLVVIALIGFIISVVAPAGYRLYNGFLTYLDDKKKKEDIKELRYNCFILQKSNSEYNITILGAQNSVHKKSSHNN